MDVLPPFQPLFIAFFYKLKNDLNEWIFSHYFAEAMRKKVIRKLFFLLLLLLLNNVERIWMGMNKDDGMFSSCFVCSCRVFINVWFSNKSSFWTYSLVLSIPSPLVFSINLSRKLIFKKSHFRNSFYYGNFNFKFFTLLVSEEGRVLEFNWRIQSGWKVYQMAFLLFFVWKVRVFSLFERIFGIFGIPDFQFTCSFGCTLFGFKLRDSCIFWGFILYYVFWNVVCKICSWLRF